MKRHFLDIFGAHSGAIVQIQQPRHLLVFYCAARAA